MILRRLKYQCQARGSDGTSIQVPIYPSVRLVKDFGLAARCLALISVVATSDVLDARKAGLQAVRFNT